MFDRLLISELFELESLYSAIGFSSRFGGLEAVWRRIWSLPEMEHVSETLTIWGVSEAGKPYFEDAQSFPF